MNCNAVASFISLRFEKGYLQAHFREAVTQAMITAVTIYNGWDADEEWQDDGQRRDKLTACRGVPVRDFLVYQKAELAEERFDDMQQYICQNAVYDNKTAQYRDYVFPGDVKAMLAYFHDVKLYAIGGSRGSGCCGCKSWIALKDDTFFWVDYSGLSD